MMADVISFPVGRRRRHPLRLLVVGGTRPEAVKLAPLVLAARARPDVHCTLVATGQHGALFDDALAVFGLTADYRLGSGEVGLSMDALDARIARSLPSLFDELKPDCVVVQGDTTSAWAAAITARRHLLPVAHVEAGLRSGNPDLPWPEERNRTQIDHVATLLFAPGEAAANNLRAEGVGGTIFVAGNTGIDAVLMVAGRPTLAAAAEQDGRRRLFATCHRRDNGPAALDEICAAFRQLAGRWDVALTVALPGDPAKAARLRERLDGMAAITLVPPLGFEETVAELKRAYLVLSDSGGLQEECPALGVPLLVLRTNSERPEVIASGNARLVGTKAATIVGAATRLLDDEAAHDAMCRPSFPYGDGTAATQILHHLLAYPFPEA